MNPNKDIKPSRVRVSEIKEALRNDCHYVFATNSDFVQKRIIAAKTKGNDVLGKGLNDGRWFIVREWHLR